MSFLIPLQQPETLLCYFIVRVFENFQLLEQVMPQKQRPIRVVAAILSIIGIIPQEDGIFLGLGKIEEEQLSILKLF